MTATITTAIALLSSSLNLLLGLGGRGLLLLLLNRNLLDGLGGLGNGLLLVLLAVSAVRGGAGARTGGFLGLEALDLLLGLFDVLKGEC